MFYPSVEEDGCEGEGAVTGGWAPAHAVLSEGPAVRDLKWASSVQVSAKGYAFELKLSEDNWLSVSAFSEEHCDAADEKKPDAPTSVAAAAEFPMAAEATFEAADDAAEKSPPSALRFERTVNKEQMDTFGFNSQHGIAIQMQIIVDALRGSDAVLTAALIPCVVPRMEASRWGLERLSEMDSSIGAEAVDEKGGEEQAASAEPTALLLRVTEDTRGGALHYYILMFAEERTEAQLLKLKVWKLRKRVTQLEKEKKEWQMERLKLLARIHSFDSKKPRPLRRRTQVGAFEDRIASDAIKRHKTVTDFKDWRAAGGSADDYYAEDRESSLNTTDEELEDIEDISEEVGAKHSSTVASASAEVSARRRMSSSGAVWNSGFLFDTKTASKKRMFGGALIKPAYYEVSGGFTAATKLENNSKFILLKPEICEKCIVSLHMDVGGEVNMDLLTAGTCKQLHPSVQVFFANVQFARYSGREPVTGDILQVAVDFENRKVTFEMFSGDFEWKEVQEWRKIVPAVALAIECPKRGTKISILEKRRKLSKIL